MAGNSFRCVGLSGRLVCLGTAMESSMTSHCSLQTASGGYKYTDGEFLNDSVPSSCGYAEFMYRITQKVQRAVSVKYLNPGDDLDPENLTSVLGDDDVKVRLAELLGRHRVLGLFAVTDWQPLARRRCSMSTSEDCSAPTHLRRPSGSRSSCSMLRLWTSHWTPFQASVKKRSGSWRWASKGMRKD